MKGGLGNIMKQAQQMQANLQKAQEELANMEVTGESGAGMVSVIMTGRHDLRPGGTTPPAGVQPRRAPARLGPRYRNSPPARRRNGQGDF